jgi:hypothetical protein
VPYQLEDGVKDLGHNKRPGLWVPAFAGTTAIGYPCIPNHCPAAHEYAM